MKGMPRPPAKAVNKGALDQDLSLEDKEKLLLSEILDRVNDLFEGELTDDDKLVYVNNVIKGKLMESEVLAAGHRVLLVGPAAPAFAPPPLAAPVSDPWSLVPSPSPMRPCRAVSSIPRSAARTCSRNAPASTSSTRE